MNMNSKEKASTNDWYEVMRKQAELFGEDERITAAWFLGFHTCEAIYAMKHATATSKEV